MSRPQRSLLSATGLILVLTPLLFGETSVDGENANVSSLPQGALRRLGTIRLQAAGPTICLAFAPDGKHLAASVGKPILPMWERPCGTLRIFLSESKHSIHCVAFSPDGLVLAVGDSDATVRLCEAKTGARDRELYGHSGTVNAVAFSPDGRTLASASDDYSVIVWNLRGRLLRRLDGHRREVLTVAFSPDGKTLATGGRDGTIRLWDTATGAERRRLATGSASVSAVIFARDGASVVAEGGERVVRQWESATGREIRSFHGHTDRVLALALTRDGNTLASRGADQTIRLWKMADGTSTRRIAARKTSAAALAFSPDDTTLACGDDDCVVELWPLAVGMKARALIGHCSPVHAIVVSDDGRELLTSGDRRTLRWDLNSGALREEIEGKSASPAKTRVEAHSPDGKIVAAEGRQAGVIVCTEVLTGRPICTLRGHLASITCLSFAADGRTLLSGSKDTSVVVWDLIACCAPADTEWPPEEKDRKRLWESLGAEDAERPFNWLTVCARHPQATLAFVKRQVPLPRDDRRLRQLLADLDSDTFAVREKASAELAKLGEAADFALRQALRDKPSLEVRRRIDDLLADRKEDVAATRRWNRLVLLMEWNGSPQAREILDALAKSSARAAVIQDARAALARFDKRTKKR